MVNTKGTFFKKGYKLNDICFDKYTFDLNEYKLKLYNLAVDLTEYDDEIRILQQYHYVQYYGPLLPDLVDKVIDRHRTEE